MSFIFLSLFVILILIIILFINDKFNILALCKRIKTVDGNPLFGVYPGRTIFGNNFDYFNFDGLEALFESTRYFAKTAGNGYVQYFVGQPVLHILKAENLEEVLNRTSIISKGNIYKLFKEFVQEGLLTSTNEKWRQRRKLLTPSFHFNILQRFMEIFNCETQKFLTMIMNQKNEILNLSKAIPKFTLNNICETALGVNLDDVEENDLYRQNIVKLEKFLVKRICNPFLHIQLIYSFTRNSKKFTKVVKELHEFSNNIINRRREKFQVMKNNDLKMHKSDQNEINYYEKQRYAMLDTLLEAEQQSLIDHKGICEEVNTFMFEGFDTTSAGLMFTILCLATYQDVQKKCYEEILSELPNDFTTLTINNINSLQYLDCAIKESLRLYPPVPFMARSCEEKTIIGNHICPKGCNINIHIFDIHRDRFHFPNPEKFDPERFFPENSIDRHPFCYIPFSAGPRNCIGQKMAMLEMKTLIINLIKNYEIFPVTKIEDIKFVSGMILRSKESIEVRLVPRKYIGNEIII